MASGDTLAVFDALASRPPASDYATIDLRGDHPVLDFDASVDAATDFGGLLPSAYGGGGLRVRVVWLATSAATGDAVWQAAFERHQVGASVLDAAAFGASASSVATVNATGGATSLAEIVLPAASLTGALAGEPYRLRLSRRATDAADTLADAAELLFVELQEA